MAARGGEKTPTFCIETDNIVADFLLLLELI